MWLSALVINPAFYALLALATSDYMLKPFFMDCSPPVAAIRLLSIWVLGELPMILKQCIYLIVRQMECDMNKRSSI